MIEKIIKIIEALPEDQRAIIFSKYSVSTTQTSPRVAKLLKIYDGLSEQEKIEFKSSCCPSTCKHDMD